MKKNHPDRHVSETYLSIEEQRRLQLAKDIGYVLAWHWKQRSAAIKRSPSHKTPVADERPCTELD